MYPYTHMARINISLPDGLHEKLQKTNFNVSEICQDALEREFQKQQTNKERMGGIEIEKLRKKMLAQKEESDLDDFMSGRAIAEDWAKDESLVWEDFHLAAMDKMSEVTFQSLLEEIEKSVDDIHTVDMKAVKIGFTTTLNAMREEMNL